MTEPRLLGPSDVRALCAQLDLHPAKALGQNFVVDPGVVARIVRLAGDAGTHVLEVGPGLGSLTLALLAAGHRVTAIEIDPRLANQLPLTVAERAPDLVGRLSVVTADAMAVLQWPPSSLPTGADCPGHQAASGRQAAGGGGASPSMAGGMASAAPGSQAAAGGGGASSNMAGGVAPAAPGSQVAAGGGGASSNMAGGVAPAVPGSQVGENSDGFLAATDVAQVQPTALVANLPYNVAVPVLLTYLERFAFLRQALVMVQAEVGARLAAPPGSRTYGAPSAKLAWWAKARLVGTVARNAFYPVPRVDSALVLAERRPPPASDVSYGAVCTVIEAAFAQRRKTLRAALAGLADGAPQAELALRAAGIDPSLRGECLGIDDFAQLARQFHG